LLSTELVPQAPRVISSYARRHLANALKADYPMPVTGYLVDAFVVANAAVGIVYRHALRDGTGRFADGHLIRTSDILNIRQFKGRWLIRTQNSVYMVVTFKRHVGKPSLVALQRLMKSTIVFASSQLH
jgi:hypothetical protein